MENKEEVEIDGQELPYEIIKKICSELKSNLGFDYGAYCLTNIYTYTDKENPLITYEISISASRKDKNEKEEKNER